MQITEGAAAVVLRGNRVLLVRRRNPPDAGLWGFPGGHVEPGETAGAAAMRELEEETGVSARARGILATLLVPDGRGGLFRLCVVGCDLVAGKPSARDDAMEAAWVPIPTVLEGGLPMSREVDRIVQRARQDRPAP